MSDGAHLLIPLASCATEGSAQGRRAPALPHLEKLLARLSRSATDPGDDSTLSMPHERVIAREVGLPSTDGLVPWAAWHVAQSGADTQGSPWAWITPCHWRVGTDHIAMNPPQALRLAAPQSQALLAAMQPFFEEDGIALAYDAPTSWLARGEVFRDLATASLDRVTGRTIDTWLPRAPRAKAIRRLQQEMQMLLYTHPINEERLLNGQLPVNSFWVSGTGALPAGTALRQPEGLRIVQSLRNAALVGDWQGWTTAWEHTDAQECARLLQELDSGTPVSLTLCGERNAQTFSGQGGGWLRKLGAAVAGKQAHAVLESL